MTAMSASGGKVAEDIIDTLANGVKASVVETCAKVAEIHFKHPDMPGAEYYNAAVVEIAARIRRFA